MPTLAKSQTIDSINVRCLYRLSYVMDTNNISQKAYDTKVLEIGSRSSKYYSYERYLGDSILNEDIEKGVNLAEMMSNKSKYNKDKSSLIVYQNFPQNAMSVTEDIGQIYLYTEEQNPQNWEILADTQTVLGIHCQMAITTFRGRDYTAWFTNKIPSIFGPWKFNGLPGLIIKISDSQNHYSFECIRIDDGHLLPLKSYSKSDFIKTTRKEMRKMLIERFQNPLGSFQANSGGVSVSFENPNLSIPSRPFNPIERTYD